MFYPTAFISLSLLSLQVLSQSFSPSEAAAGWKKVFNVVPKAATSVYGFCTSVQLSDQLCADAFLSDKPQLSYATRQAAINCMSQMEASQAQTQALLTALNVDTSKFSKYAYGGAKPAYERSNGKWVKKDFSPADVRQSMEKGRAKGNAFGHDLYKTLEFILDVNVGVLEGATLKKLPGSWPAAGVIGRVAHALMPNEEAFAKNFADAGAADGAINPQNYDVKPTGTCVRTEKDCYDADGIAYKNNDYHPDPITKPSTPSDFDDLDTGAETNPIPTSVQDEFVSSIEVIKDEVTTDVATPPNVHTDPDAPSPSENFMNQCIREESQEVTRQIGSMKTVNDAGNAEPRTDEDKAEAAQRLLLLGICDTTYFGVETCQKWKQDLQTTPVDTELHSQMQMLGTQSQLCGSLALQFGSCEEGFKEIRKRYVLDRNLETAVSSTFNPLRVKIEKMVPIRLSPTLNLKESAPKQVAANDAFASSLTVHLPWQPTTTTSSHQSVVITITDKLGQTTTIRGPTSKPTKTKETLAGKPLRVTYTYKNIEGSTIVVTTELPVGLFTTDTPAPKPLTFLGEDGRKTTVTGIRTPTRTSKVPPILRGPGRDEL